MLFVLSDLLSVMIPGRVMNGIFVIVASLVLAGVLLVAFGTLAYIPMTVKPKPGWCFLSVSAREQILAIEALQVDFYLVLRRPIENRPGL